MGGIRKQRKKYESPGHPWQRARLAEELVFVGEYGLRNKRELWRHRTMLARFRSTARDLLALPTEARGEREAQLLGRLHRLGLLEKNARLDDVLDLTVRDILERRLQTQVWRQGLAKTVHHARQLVVHGHIALNGRRVTSPGMLLYRGQEQALEYALGSPYQSPNHPERPKGAVAAPAPAAPPTPPAREVVVVKLPQIRDIKEIPIEEELEEEAEEEAEEELEAAEEEKPEEEAPPQKQEKKKEKPKARKTKPKKEKAEKGSSKRTKTK